MTGGGPRAPSPEGRVGPALAVLASALFAGGFLALTILQVEPSLEAARATGFLGAREAAWALVTLAALTAVSAVLALFLPARLRWLAAAPGLAALVAAVVAVALAGLELWSMAAALLTGLAAWSAGRLLLSLPRVRDEGLHERPVVALALGLGVLGLAVYVLGRASLLHWWTAGLAVLVLAGVGLRGLRGRARRLEGDRLRDSLGATPLRAAVVGMLGVTGALATICAGAPESRYDALFYKAWLPAHWAETGEIGPLLEHPTLNVAGLVELLAVPGHLLEAPGVGRYLQLFGLLLLVVCAWRLGNRFGPSAGPLAALAISVAPQLLRQATTAEETVVLAVLCLAAALAVLHYEGRGPRRAFLASLVVGLLGGACIFGKLYVAPFGGAIALAWVLLARAPRELAGRALGAACGLLLLGGPLFLARWVETGNPVFPFFNSTFRSPHYPLADATLGFGGPNEVVDDPPAGGPGGGEGLRIFRWLERIVTDPSSLSADAFAPGVLGLLPALFAAALVLGWRGAPARRAVWGALVIALVVWWLQWHYERFAAPYAAVALVLALPALAPLERALRPALGSALAVAAVAFAVSTVASFWNVPGRVPLEVAVGLEPDADYRLEAIPDAAALAAFDEEAEQGAILAGDAYARALLRPDLDLSPGWEADLLLYLRGFPGAGPDVVRRELGELGIRWVVLRDGGRVVGERSDFLGPLVARYGRIVFADRLRDLYVLADAPAGVRPVPLCDGAFAGEGCWLPAERVDAVPGLTDVEASGLPVEQTLPACPGATYAVRVATRPGRDPTRVYLPFDQPDPLQGVRFVDAPPGAETVLHGTAPLDARTLTIVVDTLGPTAAVERISIGVAREPAGAPCRG